MPNEYKVVNGQRVQLTDEEQAQLDASRVPTPEQLYNAKVAEIAATLEAGYTDADGKVWPHLGIHGTVNFRQVVQELNPRGTFTSFAANYKGGVKRINSKAEMLQLYAERMADYEAILRQGNDELEAIQNG